MNALFDEKYRAWLDASLVQYNKRFGENRKYHQESLPDSVNYDPGELVEIASNGHVYPHGIGGTNHTRDAVTPWGESEHFIQ